MSNEKQRLDWMSECIMIDTMGLRVENVASVTLTKQFAQVSEDPQIVSNSGWAKGRPKSESGKLAPLRVTSQKAGTRLLVEGSNSMQYVGHNIVSSNNAVMTAFSMLDAVRRHYPIEFDWSGRPLEFRRGQDVTVTRIDTPAMLKLPSGVSAGAVINALAIAGFRAGAVTTIFPNESVYFDQPSQLASLKAYLKVLEMQVKRRMKNLPETENAKAMIQLAEETIRFEAVYRMKHLKSLFGNEIVTPSMLSPKTLAAMFINLMDGFDLKGSLRKTLSNDELFQVRMPYRSTVAHWQNGADLERLFKGNEAQLKAHRRVLKKEHNIDIFLPSPLEIAMPMQLGDILRIENFVPPPEPIKTDPALFYTRDMQVEWIDRTRDMDTKGIGYVYVDPFHYDDDQEGGESHD